MWSMHERTTEEQARINRGRSNNGKISTVEDTSPSDDDWDVAIGLAGSGVVHVAARTNKSTSSTSKCRERGQDSAFAGGRGHEN